MRKFVLVIIQIAIVWSAIFFSWIMRDEGNVTTLLGIQHVNIRVFQHTFLYLLLQIKFYFKDLYYTIHKLTKKLVGLFDFYYGLDLESCIVIIK